MVNYSIPTARRGGVGHPEFRINPSMPYFINTILRDWEPASVVTR